MRKLLSLLSTPWLLSMLLLLPPLTLADVTVRIQVASQSAVTITLETIDQKALSVLLSRHNAAQASEGLPAINGTQFVAAIVDERLKALSRAVLKEAHRRVADNEPAAVGTELDAMAEE